MDLAPIHAKKIYVSVSESVATGWVRTAVLCEPIHCQAVRWGQDRIALLTICGLHHSLTSVNKVLLAEFGGFGADDGASNALCVGGQTSLVSEEWRLNENNRVGSDRALRDTSVASEL